MKTWMRVFAALMAVALLLAGCQSAGEPEDTDQPESPAPTDVSTPNEEEEEPEAALTMQDGVYEAEATGFNLTQPVQVSVEIKDNQIASITIGENGETNGMPQMVEKYMIPRIIENQTLAVDAVTGATSTSMAVRTAVRDCCEQAGADISLLQTPLPESTETEEYTVDVAVVGMGGSGTAAALSAAENGASVMAIDKAGKWAGTSAITSGPMTVNAPSQVAAEYDEWPDPITGETRVK